MIPTELCSLYAVTSVVQSDGNEVPSAATLAHIKVPCNIHRGSSRGPDMAASVGIYDRVDALAYFPPQQAGKPQDRMVLLDERSDAWLIRNEPILRNRFPATAHVWCVLSRLHVKPSGVP